MFQNEDGTYTLGPADVLCIFRLPTGRFHVTLLEEQPMPGPIQPIEELNFIRLKSKMHHTVGADTLEGAQQQLQELRQKIKVSDLCVIADVAVDIEDPVCVLPVRNWIRERITLKEAFGLAA